MSLLPYACLAGLYAIFVGRTAFGFEGRTYFTLFDDAMISMRYARNLADGHGLVWNPGERIEGYTNFLWTLWMAATHLLGLPESKVSLVVMISGAGLLLATVYVTSRTVEVLAPGRAAARVIAMLAVGLLFPLAFWTLRGTEVGLAALLIGASVLLAIELSEGRAGYRRWVLAATLSAAALTRDDLLIPAVLVVVYLAWRLPRERRLSVLSVVVGGLAVAVAAHAAFRLAYYGNALPNTYYLKLEGIGLGTRLRRGATGLGYTFLTELYPLILFAMAYFAHVRRRVPPGVLLLAAVFVAQAAYSVYVGGDAWEYYRQANRYLAVAVPSLIVIAALGIDELVRARDRWRVAVPVAAGFVAVALLGLSDWLPTERLGFPQSSGLNKIQPATALACAIAILVAVWWLGRTAPTTRRTSVTVRGVALGLIALTVLVAVNAQAVNLWIKHNALDRQLAVGWARTGVILRETTPVGAKIAMFGAGNTAYFSHRYGIDMLGKMDPVIAHTRPHSYFLPGHDKWDFAYSVGRLRPTVLAQGFRFFATHSDRCALRGWGYREIAPQLLVRDGAVGAREAELGRRVTALHFYPWVTLPSSCP